MTTNETAVPQTLALIPARGGSRRLPRKNILPLLGKPLIAWAIETALACPVIDRVVVTTEDQEIAEVAIQSGAEVPFMRPPELAADDVPGIQAVLHAVRWLEDHERYCPDYVVRLSATTPLCSSADIQAALDVAQGRSADVVISVHPAEEHPLWAREMTSDGRLVNFLNMKPESTQRQKLPLVYAPNGAINLYRRAVLLEQSGISDLTYAYIMPVERALDIDTAWHFHLAELILKDHLQQQAGTDSG